MGFIYEEVRNSGFVGYLLLFLGMIGIGIALGAVAALAGKSRAARGLGAAAVILGAVIALGGAGGAYFGRSQVERAIEGESVSPVTKERIRRAGYAESRSAARLGLGCAVVPIGAGAIALLAGSARRRDAGAGAGAGSSWTLVAALLAFAGVTVMAGMVPLMGPLPGRDLDDATWRALEAGAEVLSAEKRGAAGEGAPGAADDIGRRCRRLEEVIGETRGVADPKDLRAAADRCIDVGIQRALTLPEGQRRATLVRLSESPLILDDSAKARLQAEIDRAPEAAPPADADGLLGGRGALEALAGPAASGGPGGRARSAVVRAGAATVSGRLPPEVIQRIVRQNMARFRLCYETGLLNNPALAGRVNVRFVIGRDGTVSNVGQTGSDLPDPGVVSCVTRGFHRLSFPQPEGGIVTVTYPIVFSPGG